MGLTKRNNSGFGVLASVMSSVLFAAMFGYTNLLGFLTAEEIYGFRVVLTAPCLTVLVIALGKWPDIISIFRRLRAERFFWLLRLASSALLNVQLWLFMWAPVNGHGLDISLGYFLLPLATAIVGYIALGEAFGPLKKLACLLASIGVINEFWNAQSASWPTFVVTFGYPAYYYLRRRIGTDNLGGLWSDMIIGLPVVLLLINFDFISAIPADVSKASWLVIGLGALSASALALSALSSSLLNLTQFGLLNYVQPILMVVVSLAIGGTISQERWLTYLAICSAVVVLIIEGLLALLNANRVK